MEGGGRFMSDEQQPSAGAGAEPRPEGSSAARSPVVFASDATADASRVASALQSAGYVVVDVPLLEVVERVVAQRPNVILFDIDDERVLGELARLRKLPGSGAIDFVFTGAGDGVVRTTEDALAHDGSAFFLRPVDLPALVRKIEALTGGPVLGARTRSSNPPSRPLSSRSGGERAVSRSSHPPSGPSLPAPGLRTPGPPLPMSTTSLADLVNDMPEGPPRSLASLGTVSPELAQLLAEAELRAEALSGSELLPSPEEEIEAVLPADVLASLDEPLDTGEDEEPGDTHHRTGAGDREHTGAHAKGTTTGGSRQSTTGSGSRAASTGGSPLGTGAQTHERRLATEGARSAAPISPTTPSFARPTRVNMPPADASPSPLPRRREESPVPRPRDESPVPRRREESPAPRLRTDPVPRLPSEEETPLPRRRSEAPAAPVAPEPLRGPSVEPPPPRADESAAALVLVDASSARRFFAGAIARRASGALCFESDGVVRRIVLRDGDLVAAASGAELESLVHFLAARGELTRDEAARLAPKIPPYGRHAGAALVAHGWLGQDQLWAALRAHAEWIASAVLRLTRGTAQLEVDPPGRLRGEPSVFGAATGAEMFVELMRRSVTPDEALEQLGGVGTRITDGANQGLLSECNLSPQDLELLHRMRGGTLADLLARAPDGEVLSVLHALALLGVIDTVAAPDFRRREARADVDPEVAALDEEAVRARVRARLELVEEGDYFAVLGITRDATGYEVRRAFLELRRAFEPSRLLTPRLADLAADARKIVLVLEEAYEILRDQARRERYRRAIDACPG
ncbi:MAG: large Ala/Glu-rich protein [Labilithrix sp.]|nr:large Ala/Glu-rich protein [Labilithrix sp.]